MDELTQQKLRSFCRDLARRVRRYYADEEHRKEFEEWYFKKYGNYECKAVVIYDFITGFHFAIAYGFAPSRAIVFYAPRACVSDLVHCDGVFHCKSSL